VLHDEPGYLKPQKWADFVLNGKYRKVVFTYPSTKNLGDHTLYITGCGRSGTTLCFTLIEPLQLEGVKLDEPREIYLQKWGVQFDIWSINAKTPKLLPQVPENSLNNIHRQFNPSNAISYIEKMPEHIFRSQLLSPDSLIIFLKRDWLSVAKSIWEITD